MGTPRVQQRQGVSDVYMIECRDPDLSRATNAYSTASAWLRTDFDYPIINHHVPRLQAVLYSETYNFDL